MASVKIWCRTGADGNGSFVASVEVSQANMEVSPANPDRPPLSRESSLFPTLGEARTACEEMLRRARGWARERGHDVVLILGT